MSSINAQPIARTGRVQNWIDDPDSRLPVSCTVFVVKDEMEGEDGIEASWRFVSHGLRHGAGCAVHLSELRPEGDENGRGLTASGPVSFAKIYSVLNETLRRGGVYKNGAVVAHLDYTHPDAIKFVKAKRNELPWIKRCLNVDQHFLSNASDELVDAVLQAIANGDLWLTKITFDENGNRIHANVCLEVLLRHRATCLLQHVNAGACTINALKKAFTQGMTELCTLHGKTGVGDTGEYLDPKEDRQVGLGLLGLANFLAANKITYKDLGLEIERYLDTPKYAHPGTVVGEFVKALDEAIWAAAGIARHFNMDRAFAIAPTASCSYRYTDLRGYTTTPEIAPPISRHVDRDSGTFGVEAADYPPDCEIASEVGWEDYKRAVDGIIRLYQRTGLFHAYSFNSWSDVVTYDRDFLTEWLQSPQTSLYYSLQVRPDTQDKSDSMVALDDDFKEFFKFDASTDPVDEEPTDGFCPTDGTCSACGE
jgi:hypothetical protein